MVAEIKKPIVERPAPAVDFTNGALGWFNKLLDRSVFPQVTNAEAEQTKLGILRIALGLILLCRFTLIAIPAYYYYSPSPLGIPYECLAAVGMCLLSACIAFGIMTPLALLGLVASYDFFDVWLRMQNLGSAMAILSCMVLFLSNAGLRLSIDSLIAQHRGRGSIAARLSSWLGQPDARQLRFYQFLGFFSFAVLNLGALTFHLSDPSWTSGTTVGIAFTDSFLCSQYKLFRHIEAIFPLGIMLLSQMSIIGHTVFQLAMIPLMNYRWGKFFVVAWGSVFIFLSAACLQLSYLPYVEMVFWPLLFWHPSFVKGKPIQAAAQSWSLTRGAAMFYAVALTLSVLLSEPIWDWCHKSQWAGTVARFNRSAMEHFGLIPPVVFNRVDLSMGDNWFVIYRHLPGQPPKRLPIGHEDGSRDRLHFSDVFYFANTLKWHRALCTGDPVAYNQPGEKGREQIRKIIAYDYRLNHFKQPVTYTVNCLHADQASLLESKQSPGRFNHRATYEFTEVMGAN